MICWRVKKPPRKQSGEQLRTKFVVFVEDIKGHSRSCINIFGPKATNEKIPERLAAVVEEEVSNVSGVSENVCQKCYTEFLKFKKHLAERRELVLFRAKYVNAVKLQAEEGAERQKRCAKDSPSINLGYKDKRPRQKSRKLPPTRRSLFTEGTTLQASEIHDEPIVMSTTGIHAMVK